MPHQIYDELEERDEKTEKMLDESLQPTETLIQLVRE
jgi:hypothetical protein